MEMPALQRWQVPRLVSRGLDPLTKVGPVDNGTTGLLIGLITCEFIFSVKKLFYVT